MVDTTRLGLFPLANSSGLNLSSRIYADLGNGEVAMTLGQLLAYVTANGGGGPLLVNGAPANTVGLDGQVAFDLGAGVAYGPKSAGIWPPGVDINLSADATAAIQEAAGVAQAAATTANEAQSGAVAAAESAGSYDTLALANAALGSMAANAGVYVTSDVQSNNGLWVKQGGVLVKKTGTTLSNITTEINYVSARSGYPWSLTDKSNRLLAFFRQGGFTFTAKTAFKGAASFTSAAFASMLLGAQTVNYKSFTSRSGWARTLLDKNGRVLYGLTLKNVLTVNVAAAFKGVVSFASSVTLPGITYGKQLVNFSNFSAWRSGWIWAIRDLNGRIVAGQRAKDKTLIVNGHPITESFNAVEISGGVSAWSMPDATGFRQIFTRSANGVIRKITSSGNNWAPKLTGTGYVVYRTDRRTGAPAGLVYQAVGGGAEYPYFAVSNLLKSWGDSITAGNGATPSSTMSFPAQFAALSGYSILNSGVPGQKSTQIAMRMGALPITLTVDGNAIPAAGSTVNINAINGVALAASTTLQDPDYRFLGTPSDNLTRSLTGTIAGIHGSVTRVALGGPPSTSETYTFTPDPGTTGADCPANSPFVVDTLGADLGGVTLLIGHNNVSQPAQVQADVAAMIAFLKPLVNKIFLLSMTNSAVWVSGTTAYNNCLAINTWMKATYPQYYVVDSQGRDVRERLVASYDPSNAQDVIDHGNDVPPSSLRADNDHFTNAGYAVMAAILQEFNVAQGYNTF